MKLVYKLTIMAAIIGIPLVLSNVVFIRMTRYELEQNIRERQLDLARNLAARTDFFFDDAENRIESLFLTHGIDKMKPLELEEFLSPLVNQFASVRIITVLDRDKTPETLLFDPAEISPGDFVLHVSMVPDTAPSEVKEHINLIKNSGEEYRRRIFRSDVYSDKSGKKLLMTIARPFPDGRRTLGVEISLDTLEDVFASEKIGRAGTGAAYLVDGSGRLVAHSDRQRALSREDMTVIPAVKKMLGRKFQMAADFKDIDGTEMLGAFYTAYSAAGGWHVVVQEPRRDAYYTADLMRIQVGIAILLSIIFAVAAGLFITSTVTRPLYKLVFGAGEIGKGNLAHKVDIRGGGEMAMLADAFNHMGGALSERENAIENINRTAKLISTIIDRRQLAENALLALESIAGTSVISVAILERNDPPPKIYSIMNGQKTEAAQLPEALAHEIARVATTGVQVLLDEDTGDRLTDRHLPAVLLPVIFEDNIKGVITLAGRPDRRPFTHTDLHLYGIVASAVAVSLRNIELLEQTVEKTRMEEELKTARLIQSTLFPKHPPEIPGLDLSGFIQSASETGGDWYGFVHEPENRRIAIIIADVTGHGVPAAIVTATTHSFFKTLEIFRTGSAYEDEEKQRECAGQVLEGGGFFDPLSPDFMLRCLNKIILESTEGKLVMTLFASVYYYETGVMDYANAGHNLPLIFRESGFGKKKQLKTTYIKARGMRLGDEKTVSYKVRRMQLEPGDAILWYTDGLVECVNSDGEEYGMDRLKRVFEENAKRNSETIKNNLLGDAGRFYGAETQIDDITFVVGRVNEISALSGTGTDTPAARRNESAAFENAIIAAGDPELRKQLAWQLGGYGIEVVQVPDSVDGLENYQPERCDLCIVSMGGVMEDLGFATKLACDNPDSEMIFLCPSDFEDVIPIISEQGFPLRLVKLGGEHSLHISQCLIRKIVAPGSTDPGLASCMAKGTTLNKLSTHDTFSRIDDMQPLFDLASASGFDNHNLNLLKSIVDELLMNAMFDAPRDKNGNPKYADTRRSQRVVLDDGEAPVVEYGVDDDFFGICVTDPFGGLTRETILDYMEKRIYSREKHVDHSGGGAGLGLYHLYKMCDHLIFYVVPDRKTEVVCLLCHGSDSKPRKRGIKTLSFIEGRASSG